GRRHLRAAALGAAARRATAGRGGSCRRALPRRAAALVARALLAEGLDPVETLSAERGGARGGDVDNRLARVDQAQRRRPEGERRAAAAGPPTPRVVPDREDRKSTRLNSS